MRLRLDAARALRGLLWEACSQASLSLAEVLHLRAGRTMMAAAEQSQGETLLHLHVVTAS